MSVVPCPSPAPQPTLGIVVYSDAEFKAAYPAFATITASLLQTAFDIATIFLNNSCCSIVRDANIRQRLLYLIVAHIASLLYGQNGQPPSGLVGRVDKAAEGTVSISVAYVSDMNMSEAYFSQTPYGVLFWQATASYRSFHYIPAPAQCIPGRSGNPGFPWSGGGCGC